KNPLRPDSSLGDKNILRKRRSLPLQIVGKEDAYASQCLRHYAGFNNNLVRKGISLFFAVEKPTAPRQ
ncbi:MAG: hypothetical protein RSE31_01045, partial [Anaerovoracaceae bacterium]